MVFPPFFKNGSGWAEKQCGPLPARLLFVPSPHFWKKPCLPRSPCGERGGRGERGAFWCLFLFSFLKWGGFFSLFSFQQWKRRALSRPPFVFRNCRYVPAKNTQCFLRGVIHGRDGAERRARVSAPKRSGQITFSEINRLLNGLHFLKKCAIIKTMDKYSQNYNRIKYESRNKKKTSFIPFFFLLLLYFYFSIVDKFLPHYFNWRSNFLLIMTNFSQVCFFIVVIVYYYYYYFSNY